MVRVGHGHSEAHSFRLGLNKACALIEEKSGGTITFELYPNEELGSERQMQDLVSAGALDMCISGALNTIAPLYSLFDFPYLYQTSQEVNCVIESGLFMNYQYLLDSSDVRLLGVMAGGFTTITSQKPIRNLQDCVGLRIRIAQNPADIEIFKALGCELFPMDFTKVPEALQENVVAAHESSVENIWDARIDKIQHYIAFTRHSYNFAYVLMSERTWNLLSPSEKALFEEGMQLGCYYQRQYALDAENTYLQQLEESGMTITYPDIQTFSAQTASVYSSEFFKSLSPASDSLITTLRSLVTTCSLDLMP